MVCCTFPDTNGTKDKSYSHKLNLQKLFFFQQKETKIHGYAQYVGEIVFALPREAQKRDHTASADPRLLGTLRKTGGGVRNWWNAFVCVSLRLESRSR